MSKRLGMLLSVPLMLSAIACAPNTTETVRSVSDFCLIAKPISFSKQRAGQVEDAGNKYDTAETVKQVEDHDLVYERLCPAKVQ